MSTGWSSLCRHRREDYNWGQAISRCSNGIHSVLPQQQGQSMVWWNRPSSPNCLYTATCCLCRIHPWYDKQVDVYLLYHAWHLFQHLITRTSHQNKAAPALTGRPPPNDIECNLMALPTCLGGIALTNPTQACDGEYQASVMITEALQEMIHQQSFYYCDKATAHQLEAKKTVYTNRGKNRQRKR